MMKKYVFLRLCLILTVAFSAYSCRTDPFHENESFNNTSKFQLTSKRISLNEAKHKSFLLPELEKAEKAFKNSKTNVNGRVIDYGNGVSIDTDDVIYIENGPNYHTYTFHIKKDNAPANAPLENLLLVPRPDGKYNEFLIAYNLTEAEREKLRAGLPIDTNGKTQVTELANGTFNGGSQLARLVCTTSSYSYWEPCSGTHHHDGSNYESCPIYQGLEQGTPPINYVIVTTTCLDINDDVITPTDPGGNSGGGGGGGGSTPGGTTPPPNDPPCTEPIIPTSPEPGFTDENGCPIGSPSLPNLPPKNNPCEKTKALLNNPEFQTKLDSLKNKSLSKGEIGFKTKKDGTVTGYISGGKHEVDLGVKAGYQGGYHNHTPKGIPMHSPPDIDNNLLAFARAQPTGEHKNAYFGMIMKKTCTGCPSGFKIYHYIIRFDGTYNDALTSFSDADLKMRGKDYEKLYTDLTYPFGSYGSTYIDSLTGDLTNEGLEVLFFDTINKMGLTNKVILQRIEDNGTVNNINLNPDGLHITPIPCP